MPRAQFRALRAALRVQDAFYLLQSQPEAVSERELEQLRVIFSQHGIAPEQLVSREDLENAAFAVMGRAVEVR